MDAFFNRKRTRRRTSTKSRIKPSRYFEQLESRQLLTTYHVQNLNDSGSGSLRRAILDANLHAGADKIEFDVQGTISLTSGALPLVTGKLNIDGTSALNFAGTPTVSVDFNGFTGLKFATGASGSALRSLSLVDSLGNGVALIGVSHMLIVGNFIGLGLDGDTVIANRGNGIQLIDSRDTTIGGTGPDDCNVISGNRLSGIRLSHSRRIDILGNCIGTDETGELERGNRGSGIVVTFGSYGNVIGGDAANVISGNRGDGVLLQGHSKDNTVASNRIGTNMGGTAAVGNHGDGIRLLTTKVNLIGRSNIVTGINYYNSADGSDITTNVQGWQGIRAASTAGNYLIVGTSGSSGVLYDGSIDGNSGTTTYPINVPGSTETTVYSPNLDENGNLRLVGTYQANNSTGVLVNGFAFQGTLADLNDDAYYKTINYPDAQYNYVHSTAGDLAVGNYTNEDNHGHKDPGKAFIYDLAHDTFLPDVVFPGSKQTSAYAIWWNGGTKYTIAGGYSTGLTPVADGQPLSKGYLVDFDSATQKFTHWKSYGYPGGSQFLTHFQGLSSVEPGIYTLVANSVAKNTGDPVPGSWVVVQRNSDGSFGDGSWVDLDFDNGSGITTGDSVYGNQVVGIVIGESISYQATIDVGFQLSNVISGNYGNGIGIYGAEDNQVAMNYIGVNWSGQEVLGNGKNGILITDGATHNLIGGTATGGNDPTNDVFVTPPQGNLISGNELNGVLISGKSTSNQLSGNFIGTGNTGTVALANGLDGVAIVNADHNSLLGCTFEQSPFVYYNVISGNAGNGLRVRNSDYTKIQANFFGLGADNNSNVGNGRNGVLVEGNSAHTTMGGPIPLGNVASCNGENGVYVRNSASYFISYNTFAGLAAFTSATTFGNGQDGIKITATGGNNYLRTNVASNNHDDGIDIAGNASDVRITGNIVGLDSYGFTGMGNAGNGIEVRGTAHDIVIGGLQPSLNVIPESAISANGANGVAVLESAHDIAINYSYIGLNILGTQAFGNANNGVYLGPGTSNTVIGAANVPLRTVISGNGGNGIEIDNSDHNAIYNATIGADLSGMFDFGNGANGIYIHDSHDNRIGGKNLIESGNTIAFNDADGVFVQSGDRNRISRNSIYSNADLGIDLGPGANNDQAAPVLSEAHLVSALVPVAIEVSGTLTSRANSTFTIEFFANYTSGPSGRYLLSSKVVTTDASGVANFTYYGPLPPAGAGFITATATDALGNTSEFSNAVQTDDWPSFIPGIYLLDPR